MKKSELKYLIKECLIEEGIVNDSTIEYSVMLREGVIKKAIEKFRSKLKNIDKGSTEEDIAKETQLKATSLLATNKIEPFKVDMTQYSISEGLFSHKSNDGTFKVGKHVLRLLGTTSNGNMVCTCDEAKIRGNLVKLFATEGYSLMNEGVVNALLIIIKYYDDCYNQITEQVLNMLKKGDTSCNLKISDLTYAWSQAAIVLHQDTGKSGWIEVVVGYTTNDKNYDKIAMYLSYNPGMDKMYVGGFKWD